MANYVTLEEETLETVESVIVHDVQVHRDENDMYTDNSKQRECSLSIKLPNFARFNIMDTCLKVIFVVLSIPWLISTIFASVFDTKCIIFDHASMVNCSQEVFIAKPRHWVFAWFLMSIMSSALLLLIVYLNCEKVNYQIGKAKKIYKKGYFVSLMFLTLVSLLFYSIRLYNTRLEKTSLSISILILFSVPVTVLLICCLNYLPRIAWRKSRHTFCTLVWSEDCLRKNSNFIIYWWAVVLYLIENACKVVGMMLNLAEEVAPLIENKFPEKAGHFRSVMVIVIGLRLTFHARVLNFFWQKLFYGNRDLFSEPNLRLVDESRVQEKQESEERVDELELVHV
ncbi:uncharacterized protein LOC114517304 [Dendronephthya gigantea]|uniref:uncharacterized protein LOC114517304 n=1 Tax=Dendronephthya gigantea TaxID=151771 RepID=UPI00106C5572|nr:uncharacterized protein LOC114517304 [Dendronephthya gigantea]